MPDAKAHERIWAWGDKGLAWTYDSSHGQGVSGYSEYIRADLVEALKAENQRLREALDPDNLAQIIRVVDGGNRLGAGALAEKISAALRSTETSHDE